jgi:hypothetical protein
MTVRFNQVKTPHILFMQGGFSEGSSVILSHSNDNQVHILTIDGRDFSVQAQVTSEQLAELLQEDPS